MGAGSLSHLSIEDRDWKMAHPETDVIVCNPGGKTADQGLRETMGPVIGISQKLTEIAEKNFAATKMRETQPAVDHPVRPSGSGEAP